MGLLWNRGPEPEPESTFDSRVIPGVEGPDGETTYGMMKQMATDMRDKDWVTASEKGLAMSILAIIHDFEHELQDRS